jgi:N-dimethylarginine dimethylaminohydrolase
MQAQMNKSVLMSGADFFDDTAAINPFMHSSTAIDKSAAVAEHTHIQEALRDAGIHIVQVSPPADCQDGVYVANWALVRGNKAVIASLPNARKAEEPYAEQVLHDLGKTIIHVPKGLRFSGQGDALTCGNYLFCGSGYRSDEAAQAFVADVLGYDRIQLHTVPKRSWFGRPAVNKASGWPDSYFYDIDLALSVLREPATSQKGLIAWCPEAFTKESRALLQGFTMVDKIEVSLHEAKQAFACNLVSTGNSVVMSAHAPDLKAELKTHGFTVFTPKIAELSKGGGYIRCTTLTLDN